MQSFIGEVAQHVLAKYQSQLDQVEIIFPNRRAGLFFRKRFAELIDKPVWMPAISSFEMAGIQTGHLEL